MERETERKLAAHAVELGVPCRSRCPAGVDRSAGHAVVRCGGWRPRRSALAGLADAGAAVAALTRTLRDRHPQVRQYAVKARKAYGTASESALTDLRDLAANDTEKAYNRRDAAAAVETIEEALRLQAAGETHVCQRCGAAVAPDEFARSMKMFQRIFCDHCFDETYIRRRNFDTAWKSKRRSARQTAHSCSRMVSGASRSGSPLTASPTATTTACGSSRVGRSGLTFYLPEYDVYIEYWGMDTLDYKIVHAHQQQMYQHAGKRLISLYPQDKPNLDAILSEKLLRIRPTDSASAPSTSGVGVATRSKPDNLTQKGTQT